jgi:hypothetical protein
MRAFFLLVYLTLYMMSLWQITEMNVNFDGLVENRVLPQYLELHFCDNGVRFAIQKAQGCWPGNASG